MAVLVQVLPFVAMLVVAVGLLLLVRRLVGRGVTSRRPREDADLQHHQQSARSQIGGGGYGM